MTTSSPTTQNGPTTAPSPNLASELTCAVTWICAATAVCLSTVSPGAALVFVDGRDELDPVAVRFSRSAVDDGREQLSLRAEGAVDAGFTAQLPYVGAVVHDFDVQIEPIARHDGMAKLGFVDAEKIHEARLGIEWLGNVRENAANLGERFENEHAGHDGPAWEVALKPWFVDGNRLVPVDAL